MQRATAKPSVPASGSPTRAFKTNDAIPLSLRPGTAPRLRVNPFVPSLT